MYYKYFRGVIKNQGVPNLNSEQHVKMHDIAYFEGALNILKKLKEKTIKTEERYKYDVEIMSIEGNLSRLLNLPYGKEYPKSVLNGMLIKSQE